MARQKRTPPSVRATTSYRYPEADLPVRPEIGAQAHFRKSKAPAAYRFDSSLAPELCWDGQNPAREQGEALVGGSNGRNGEPVAILFGPADGPLSERLVSEAWDEAGLKHYTRLFVIGFGIDHKAREFVEKAGQVAVKVIDPRGNELIVVKKLEVRQ